MKSRRIGMRRAGFKVQKEKVLNALVNSVKLKEALSRRDGLPIDIILPYHEAQKTDS